MTFVEAEAALGAPLAMTDDYGPDPDACNYATSPALPGVLVMVEEGRVARFDLAQQSTVRSDKGIALGDPATAVEAAYGGVLRRTPHQYVQAPGAYLEWWNADRTRGIRYEIAEDGRVSDIYVGGGQVSYVEGCA